MQFVSFYTTLFQWTDKLQSIIMAALHSRWGHYIFALWFLSIYLFFLSSPNLSRRRLDVYHTSAHGVALVVMRVSQTLRR